VDIYPQSDTLTVNRKTDSRDDIEVASLTHPTDQYDKVGSTIDFAVRLRNLSPERTFDTVVVNALITAPGKADIQLNEILLTNFIAGSTRDCQFSPSYLVPEVSNYTLTVFVTKVDNKPLNDTMSITRQTDLRVNTYHTASFTLGQNIPNPAKDNTRIEYNLPSDGQVIFTVYSITGQNLHIEKRDAYSGKNDIEFNTTNLAAGIYYYSMEYNGERLVKKMTIKK